MVKTATGAYLLLLLTSILLSCQKERPNDNHTFHTLQESISIIAEANAGYYHGLESRVINNGNNEDERAKLDKAKALLDIKKKYNILSQSDWMIDDLETFENEFTEKVNSYITRSPNQYDIEKDWSVFQRHIDEWKQNQGTKEETKERLMLVLDILRLEYNIIRTVDSKIGWDLVDYFYARANFYAKTDTLSAGSLWPAMITVGTQDIGEYRHLKLSDPIIQFYEVVNNNYQHIREPAEYKLETFQPWAWLVNFTPQKPGIYAVGFEANLTSQLMDEDAKSIQLFKGISNRIVVIP